MKNKAILALLIGSTFILTACSPAKVGSSEEMVQKFKEGVKTIKSVDFELELEMSGDDAGDEADFELMAQGQIDQKDPKNPKMALAFQANGSLEADENEVDGEVDAEIRSIGGDFYFNLKELKVSDPAFASFAPVLSIYKNKWQRLASDFLPAEVQDLQARDEEQIAREEALKDLFVATKMIDIVEDHGLESVGGRSLYHVEIALNKEGMKTYLTEAAKLNEQEGYVATDEMLEGLDYIDSIDLWVSPEDFYPYQMAIDFDFEEGEVTTDMEYVITAKSFNEDYSIEAPQDAQEFNPLALLMGAQMGGGLPTDLGELPQ